jgi:hypothetical protein
METKSMKHFIFILIILIGCASSEKLERKKTSDKKSSQEASDNSNGKIDFDEGFDPLSLNDDDIKIEQKGSASSLHPGKNIDVSVSSDDNSKETKEQKQVSSEQTTNEQNMNAVPTEPEMIPGYRVQIFASTDIDKADEARREAILKFPQHNIYRIYEPPYYRIRVGDCITNDEATALRQSAVDSGYKNAWIVRDKIVKSQTQKK